MDKERETNLQQIPSLIPNHNNNVTTTITLKEESPRKPISGGGGGGDRLKRDEWSEGAVSSLLEAYENKWVLRNRAKLKGHDWEDVARYVSSRANCTKSPKTQTQCKNKIESMKKRYRSESTADASSWPLYSRLDLLLRGNGPPPAVTITQPPPVVVPPPPPTLLPASTINPPLLLLDPSPVGVAPPAPPPTAAPPPPQNSNGSNGVDRMAKEDGGMSKVISEHGISDKNSMDTDSSTPALYSDEKEKMRSRKPSKKTKMMEKMKKKRKRSSSSSSKEEYEIAESIRWLAEVVVKSEQARMETMREIERIRVEAEAKRAEMDLKRTEIIANTQLEIARLFATSGGVAGKPVDSSLRIGRN
ncbi:hypothetical protein UlMin_026775 [Ulmus minor]